MIPFGPFSIFMVILCVMRSTLRHQVLQPAVSTWHSLTRTEDPGLHTGVGAIDVGPGQLRGGSSVGCIVPGSCFSPLGIPFFLITKVKFR